MGGCDGWLDFKHWEVGGSDLQKGWERATGQIYWQDSNLHGS